MRRLSVYFFIIVSVTVVEFFIFKNMMSERSTEERDRYSNAVDAYNTAKDKYESEYDRIIDYKKSLDSSVDEMSAQITDLTKKLNEAVAELNSIYEGRQHAAEVEAERYESLSEEEKEYENRVTEYNQMISDLRKNNSDYEAVYLKIFSYLDADVGKMSSKEIKTFYNLILEKHKYEAEYKKQSSGN